MSIKPTLQVQKPSAQVEALENLAYANLLESKVDNLWNEYSKNYGEVFGKVVYFFKEHLVTILTFGLYKTEHAQMKEEDVTLHHLKNAVDALAEQFLERAKNSKRFNKEERIARFKRFYPAFSKRIEVLGIRVTQPEFNQYAQATRKLIEERARELVEKKFPIPKSTDYKKNANYAKALGIRAQMKKQVKEFLHEMDESALFKSMIKDYANLPSSEISGDSAFQLVQNMANHLLATGLFKQTGDQEADNKKIRELLIPFGNKAIDKATNKQGRTLKAELDCLKNWYAAEKAQSGLKVENRSTILAEYTKKEQIQASKKSEELQQRIAELDGTEGKPGLVAVAKKNYTDALVKIVVDLKKAEEWEAENLEAIYTKTDKNEEIKETLAKKQSNSIHINNHFEACKVLANADLDIEINGNKFDETLKPHYQNFKELVNLEAKYTELDKERKTLHLEKRALNQELNAQDKGLAAAQRRALGALNARARDLQSFFNEQPEDVANLTDLLLLSVSQPITQAAKKFENVATQAAKGVNQAAQEIGNWVDGLKAPIKNEREQLGAAVKEFDELGRKLNSGLDVLGHAAIDHVADAAGITQTSWKLYDDQKKPVKSAKDTVWMRNLHSNQFFSVEQVKKDFIEATEGQVDQVNYTDPTGVQTSQFYKKGTNILLGSYEEWQQKIKDAKDALLCLDQMRPAPLSQQIGQVTEKIGDKKLEALEMEFGVLPTLPNGYILVDNNNHQVNVENAENAAGIYIKHLGGILPLDEAKNRAEFFENSVSKVCSLNGKVEYEYIEHLEGQNPVAKKLDEQEVQSYKDIKVCVDLIDYKKRSFVERAQKVAQGATLKAWEGVSNSEHLKNAKGLAKKVANSAFDFIGNQLDLTQNLPSGFSFLDINGQKVARAKDAKYIYIDFSKYNTKITFDNKKFTFDDVNFIIQEFEKTEFTKTENGYQFYRQKSGSEELELRRITENDYAERSKLIKDLKECLQTEEDVISHAKHVSQGLAAKVSKVFPDEETVKAEISNLANSSLDAIKEGFEDAKEAFSLHFSLNKNDYALPTWDGLDKLVVTDHCSPETPREQIGYFALNMGKNIDNFVSDIKEKFDNLFTSKNSYPAPYAEYNFPSDYAKNKFSAEEI